MVWLSLFLPLTLFFSSLSLQQTTTYSQQGSGTSSSPWSPELRARIERDRQAAVEINDLAARIHSETDANVLVDKIAEEFADMLPAAWLTRGIRKRIARAEYEAVSDPSRLIPEQRIADIWNEYVREIAASDEALVTSSELHNLRDADFAVAQFAWSRRPNIWTVSNIYALGPDAKLADGCRPIETLRIFYDLDMMFDNLRAARDRVRRGTLVSDELKKRRENSSPQQKTTVRLESRLISNPLGAAEFRYVQQNGPFVLNGFIEKLFDELFPPAD